MREPVHISQIVGELGRLNLLPTIVFRSSRSQCDVDAERSGANPQLRLPIAHQQELRSKVRDIISAYEMDPELITSHPHYNSLVLTGIGAHHAGQLLMWRLLLEELMATGLLRALVATGTVAAGVDFPARTVVITAHSKRGADGFRQLTSAEFQQMSGRAGRRGKDTVGFCVAAPSLYCDARALLRISRQPPEPLISAYFPSPSTVLNLLRYRTVDGLRYTVERSLAAFVDRRDSRRLREHAMETFLELPVSTQERFGLELNTLPEPLRELPEIPAESGASFSKEQKKSLKKIRRMFKEAGGLENRQLTMLETTLTGLQHLGYLDGLSLSEKGSWAANLCTSLVLELAEIIESNLFHEASVETLVAVVAAISGDPHRQYMRSKTRCLSKEQEEKLSEILKLIAGKNMPGTAEHRIVSQDAAHTALVWLQSENWHQFRSLLLLSDVAEGDAARLITQTAEQLSQIARLTETHFALAMRAEESKRRLLRPPLTEEINFEGSS